MGGRGEEETNRGGEEERKRRGKGEDERERRRKRKEDEEGERERKKSGPGALEAGLRGDPTTSPHPPSEVAWRAPGRLRGAGGGRPRGSAVFQRAPPRALSLTLALTRFL